MDLAAFFLSQGALDVGLSFLVCLSFFVNIPHDAAQSMEGLKGARDSQSVTTVSPDNTVNI